MCLHLSNDVCFWGLHELVLCMGRLTIWKGGQGSCIFNSCIEGGISAGVICIYGNSLFITALKAAGALLEWPDMKEGRAPAALNVGMKREFHQVLHIYKWHLLKFHFQYNCQRYRSPVLLFRWSGCRHTTSSVTKQQSKGLIANYRFWDAKLFCIRGLVQHLAGS